MFRIPVLDQNDQIMELSLSGEYYFLRLKWNSTCECWTADISDSSQEDLVNGLTINPNCPLFLSVASDALPAGRIICIVPDRRDTLSYDDLVNGVAQLFYVEPEDYLAT